MKYNFDEVINRKGSISSKWDNVGPRVGNPDALPMWVADMDFRCPQPVIDAVKEKAEYGIYGYPYLIPEFKTATQIWMRRHGWEVASEDILFAASVIPAMFNAVQAYTEPGEKVIIQRPVYYPFTSAIEDNGRIVANNALIETETGYELDFDNLEKLAADPQTHLMLLCNPHNPVCKVFSKEELQRIGEICVRNQVVIFSDEIHSDFIYTGYRHIPLASLSEEVANVTVTAVAPSKTFNLAGMRSAAVIIHNPQLRTRMAEVFNRNRSAMVPLFGLVTYIAAYEHGDEYVEQLVEYLEGNIAYLDSYLKENMPKVRLTPPQGTYLMWLDFRKLGMTKERLDDFCVNQALVAMDKGHWFGAEGEGFMRMNIACPRATLEQGLSQLKEQYDKHGF